MIRIWGKWNANALEYTLERASALHVHVHLAFLSIDDFPEVCVLHKNTCHKMNNERVKQFLFHKIHICSWNASTYITGTFFLKSLVQLEMMYQRTKEMKEMDKYVVSNSFATSRINIFNEP